MINVYNKFYENLCYNEIFDSKYLKSLGLVLGEEKTKESFLKYAKNNEVKLFDSLIKFYEQAEYANLNWEIVNENHRNGKEREAIFKEDPWLKKNYLDNGYSWEAVKILLSGHLAISELKNIVDIEDIKLTGIYDAAIKVGLPAGSLRPIDFNEFAIACMKIEDGKLIDNIYLYTGFGGLPVALHDMKINFEKYLDLAYKAKCFNYWNLVYCLKDKVPNYELMKRYFPVIFPHLEPDLEDFGITY